VVDQANQAAVGRVRRAAAELRQLLHGHCGGATKQPESVNLFHEAFQFFLHAFDIRKSVRTIPTREPLVFHHDLFRAYRPHPSPSQGQQRLGRGPLGDLHAQNREAFEAVSLPKWLGRRFG
jgi:hypothetical protein